MKNLGIDSIKISLFWILKYLHISKISIQAEDIGV